MESECLVGDYFLHDEQAEMMEVEVEFGLDNDCAFCGKTDCLMEVRIADPIYDEGVAHPMDDEGVAHPIYDEGVAHPIYDEGVAHPVDDEDVAD